MKTLLLILTLGLSSLLPGHAQTPNGPRKPEQEIRKLMNDWMIAVLKRDANTLTKLVGPEFKLADASKAGFDRPVVTRETWMMNNSDGLKVDSVHYDKMKVYVVDNVAVVKSTFYWKGSRRYGVATPDPGKNSREYTPFVDSATILVDTWIRRKQSWQVFNRLRVDDPRMPK